MLKGNRERATVTGAEKGYEGSVTLDRALMEGASAADTAAGRAGPEASAGNPCTKKEETRARKDIARSTAKMIWNNPRPGAPMGPVLANL